MCNPSKYQERFFFSLSAKQSKYHLKIENSLVLSVCCVNKRKKTWKCRWREDEWDACRRYELQGGIDLYLNWNKKIYRPRRVMERIPRSVLHLTGIAAGAHQ